VLIGSLTRVGALLTPAAERWADDVRRVDNRALEIPSGCSGGAKDRERGSLTIIATCLVDTGSRMIRSFIRSRFSKGTANIELARVALVSSVFLPARTHSADVQRRKNRWSTALARSRYIAHDSLRR